MKMDLDTTTHSGLGPLYLSKFNFHGGVEYVRDSGYYVLWNYGGSILTGEGVGSQAEVTIPFLPYSVSLLVPFDLSILFLISLWWILWGHFWVPQYLLPQPNCSPIADKSLSFLNIHFHHSKAKRLVLAFLLPYKSLRRRKKKEFTECSRHPGKRRCMPKVISLSHGGS